MHFNNGVHNFSNRKRRTNIYRGYKQRTCLCRQHCLTLCKLYRRDSMAVDRPGRLFVHIAESNGFCNYIRHVLADVEQSHSRL